MEGNQYNDARVAFALAASRRLAAFVVLAAGATLSLLMATPLERGASLAVALWCAAVAIHALARNRAREVRITHGISISVDGREGSIVAGSFVSPWLTIVRWRPAGSRFTRTLLVLPDMIDAECFRALRVILRWAPASRSAGFRAAERV